jgi:Leucine-rich repeat (LRR) protein
MGFYWNLNGISVQDAKTLANSLKLALNLESLTIRGCSINDECCKIICAGILACKNLRKLNLSHNDIRDYGARAAATLIAQDDPLIRGKN